MDIDTYQQLALKRAIYPSRGANIVYPALALCGESGEVAEKVKKILRDGNGVITDDVRASLVKELGDVLWYIAAFADELGVTLETVAQANLDKVNGRHERGTLHGSGDDR